MDSEQDTPGSDKLLRWTLKKEKRKHKIYQVYKIENTYHKNTVETLKKSET